MNAKTATCLIALPIRTPDGQFVARYSPKGLAGLAFPASAQRHHPKEEKAATSPRIRTWHRATTRALLRAIAGGPPGKLPPLDLSAGTDFQKCVWGALRKIALGRTRSYAEIARAIGKAGAVRAVGGACGANPIPVFVPCHRVLAANRKLGGFSGGLDWKRTLLAREGVLLKGEGRGGR
jgi:methylated-DNA-[protein]-cysteine S-methyltransferase